GYVRATVPTKRAESTIKAASKLSSVLGIDLKQEIKLDDPTPKGDRAAGAKQLKATGSYAAPNKKTPAKNPKADGRGITIGILDSGVDLGHPALKKTTTGERKIVDWVTATDPVSDGDGTWLRMTESVTGPTFTSGGKTYSAPAGNYKFATFAEAATTGGEMAGDLNRDGDTTDVWGVLYDPVTGTTRVDLNNNADFSDDKVLKPYKEKFQVSYFGEDDPRTQVVERIP
ncbi:hypothetical protein AB0C16_40185, partial [Nonomuraea sp. NPDC048916]